MCEQPGHQQVEVCGEVVCGSCFEQELMAQPVRSFRPARPMPEGAHGPVGGHMERFRELMREEAQR